MLYGNVILCERVKEIYTTKLLNIETYYGMREREREKSFNYLFEIQKIDEIETHMI